MSESIRDIQIQPLLHTDKFHIGIISIGGKLTICHLYLDDFGAIIDYSLSKNTITLIVTACKQWKKW